MVDELASKTHLFDFVGSYCFWFNGWQVFALNVDSMRASMVATFTYKLIKCTRRSSENMVDWQSVGANYVHYFFKMPHGICYVMNRGDSHYKKLS